MFEFIAALVVFAVVVFALSLIAILRNRPLKGSCGGLNNLKKLLGFTPCVGCTEAGPDCPLRKIRELQKTKGT
ncbi:MAG: (Na+)-NQR maturation NqrM [Phycisphaerae bacterium]|nr:(Na+)-NQR maturation NqrM [Phycisphaerae bacterium]